MIYDNADIPRTNWSGNLQYSTGHVFAPSNLQEVREIVSATPRIKALGSRHCFNDIADTTGTHLSMRALKGITIDPAAHTVEVGGGIAYGELAPVLDRAGFALHNLASLPHITVAGALATATHGSGVGNGNLATVVRALEFVRADGGVVQLSRDRDGDRFKLAVVHLGALGIVTRITLDVVPRFDMTQVVYQGLSFDRLQDGLHAILSAGYSVSLFTTWQNNQATQVWIKDKVRPDEAPVPYSAVPKEFHGATLQEAKLHPLGGMPPQNCTDQMGSMGPWYERLPHFKMEFTPSSGEELQSEYFVPLAAGYSAIRAVQTLSARIAPHLIVAEIRAIAADDLPMSMSYRQDCLAFHFTWKPDEAAIRALLPALEAKLAPFGVRPHWGKVFTMPGAQIQELYPAVANFRELAAEMDPDGKFQNAWLKRTLFSLI